MLFLWAMKIPIIAIGLCLIVFGACKTSCSLESQLKFPAVVALDSIDNYYVEFDINNLKNGTYKYAHIVGQPDDKEAYMTLNLYRQTDKGFTEKIDLVTTGEKKLMLEGEPVEFDRSDTAAEVITPDGYNSGYRFALMFDVKKKGKYKLGGLYRTPCLSGKKEMPFNDIIFEVR